MPDKKSILCVVTLIFCLFIQLSFQQSDQKTLPQSVIREMAKRETRYHHYLWHNIRDNWNRYSSSTQRELRDLGWAPPRPARRFSDGSSIAITDNNSGEDFLYMHRQMIRKVNNILSANRESYGRVRGWTAIPAPGDRDWPVPSAYTEPGNSGRTTTIRNWKQNSFYTNNIRSMERLFTNPTELRKMSLGELGSRIDVTIHGWLHLRFSSSSSYGYRPGTSRTLPDIDKRWDDPRYNWLVDTYSSHVHPVFWKIHGWVDDRIEDWRRANGLSSIRWRGTWEGGPMSRISHLWNKKETSSSLRGANGDNMEEVMEDTMMKVAEIISKEGFESSFADPVLLNVPKKPKSRLCKRKLSRKARR